MTTPCFHHRQQRTNYGISSGHTGSKYVAYLKAGVPDDTAMNSFFFCDMIAAHVLLFDKPTLSGRGSIYYVQLLYGVSEQTISSRFSASRAMLSAAAKPTDIL